MSEPVKVFDSPLGIGNIDDPKSERFQIPTQPGQQKPLLARAENVDLDRAGGMRRRAGRTKVRTLAKGHSGWGCALGSFYADGGTLYQFDPRASADTAIQTGLNEHAEISYAEVAGQVFWCNGNEAERIVSGVAAPWGLQIANMPMLSTTTGALRAGRYLVAVAPLSGEGIEGGVRRPSEHTLGSDGGISVSVTGIDPNATALNVYLSETPMAAICSITPQCPWVVLPSPAPHNPLSYSQGWEGIHLPPGTLYGCGVGISLWPAPSQAATVLKRQLFLRTDDV